MVRMFDYFEISLSQTDPDPDPARSKISDK